MPLMVTIKEWGLGSRAKDKAAKSEKPPKPAPDKKAPKSVQECDARLRRLGPYPMVTGPYDALDYDALTRRRLDWTRQRGQLLAQRHELGKRTDNDAISAKGTVELSADEVRKNATRVRQSEAWRFKHLDAVQRQAEVEMETAYKARTSGMGAAVSKYGRIGGHSDAFDISAAIDATWRNWIEAAERRAIDVPAVLGCLAEPKTLPEVERERGLKPGQALSNYQRGLDLWSELRGWVAIR